MITVQSTDPRQLAIKSQHFVPVLLVGFPDNGWYVTSGARDLTLGGRTYSADSGLLPMRPEASEETIAVFRNVILSFVSNSTNNWYNRFQVYKEGTRVDISVRFIHNGNITLPILTYNNIIASLTHQKSRTDPITSTVVTSQQHGQPQARAAFYTTADDQKKRDPTDNSMDYVARTLNVSLGGN